MPTFLWPKRGAKPFALCSCSSITAKAIVCDVVRLHDRLQFFDEKDTFHEKMKRKSNCTIVSPQESEKDREQVEKNVGKDQEQVEENVEEHVGEISVASKGKNDRETTEVEYARKELFLLPPPKTNLKGKKNTETTEAEDTRKELLLPPLPEATSKRENDRETTEGQDTGKDFLLLPPPKTTFVLKTKLQRKLQVTADTVLWHVDVDASYLCFLFLFSFL